MINITDPQVLARYLHDIGYVKADESFQSVPLSGGISCKVIKVTTSSKSFVIKQARPQLQVEEEWFSDVRRIFIERDCMKVYNDFVPGRAPKLLFNDEQNYIIIMEAAHEEAVTWKDELLRGNMSVIVAEKVATALATVHNKAATCENVRTRFHDKTFFAQLRTDPYLETLKARHPDIKADIEKKIETLLSSQITLVHGDYSPKNILVKDDEIFIIDFEVAHIGHPAFDLAFLTNHLLLKSVKYKERTNRYMHLLHTFTTDYFSHIHYMDADELERETVPLLALLFLARVDGKSPADYITEKADKQFIRTVAKYMLQQATTFKDVEEIMREKMAK